MSVSVALASLLGLVNCYSDVLTAPNKAILKYSLHADFTIDNPTVRVSKVVDEFGFVCERIEDIRQRKFRFTSTYDDCSDLRVLPVDLQERRSAMIGYIKKDIQEIKGRLNPQIEMDQSTLELSCSDGSNDDVEDLKILEEFETQLTTGREEEIIDLLNLPSMSDLFMEDINEWGKEIQNYLSEADVTCAKLSNLSIHFFYKSLEDEQIYEEKLSCSGQGDDLERLQLTSHQSNLIDQKRG